MDLKARLDEVLSRLGDLERRVARLEGGAHPVARAAAEDEEPGWPADHPAAVAIRGFAWRERVPLLGRTLVVLGGAFLLRALTEAELLPQGGGIILGLAYAVLWVAWVHRSAAAGRRPSAAFHGLAAAVIGFPLIWESTVQFRFFSLEVSFLLLVLLTGLGLTVAARHRLRLLGWLFTFGSAAASMAIAVGMRELAFAGSLLLVLGAGTWWLGYLRRWRSLARLTALMVDGVLALLTVIALRAEGERAAELLDAQTLVILLITLMVVYIGSTTARSIARLREVDFFEIAQAAVAVGVGLGGGVAVVRTAGLAPLGLGAASLTLAAACYAIGSSVDRRLPGRRSFLLFASLALVFTLSGFPLLFGGSALVLAYAGAGLLVGWLGTWRQRVTLYLHGAGYVLACAVTSGLLWTGINAFFGPLHAETPALGAWVALVSALASCAFHVETRESTWGRYQAMPKVIVLVVSVIGLAGLFLVLAGPAILSLEEAPDPAGLAVLRTAAIAVAAVGLAAVGRWPRLREAAWLVYPVLVIGGLKLLAEDIPTGRPATMVASLALFGGALILAPRLTRGTSAQDDEAAAEEEGGADEEEDGD